MPSVHVFITEMLKENEMNEWMVTESESSELKLATNQVTRKHDRTNKAFINAK